MRNLISFQFIFVCLFALFIHVESFAQNDTTNDSWVNNTSTTVSSPNNVSIGSVVSTNHPLYVNKTVSNTWGARIQNGTSQVSLAHQSGYGMFVKSGGTVGGYALNIRSASNNDIIYANNNGNVGIGKTPSTKLDVKGQASCQTSFTVGQHSSSNRGLVVDNGASYAWPLLELKNVQGTKLVVKGYDGKVGIGTAQPLEKLHVNGSIRGSRTGGALRINTDHGFLDIGAQNAGFAHLITDRSRFYFNRTIMTNDGFSSYYNKDLKLQTYQTTRITVKNSNGNEGIGTETPAYRLDVCGTARAKEVKVESGWCDYVFADDYKLPSIEEEARFIEKHKHLMSLESEQAMNGEIQVGDVTKRQQETIEKMMLHIIALNNEIKTIKEQLKTK